MQRGIARNQNGDSPVVRTQLPQQADGVIDCRPAAPDRIVVGVNRMERALIEQDLVARDAQPAAQRREAARTAAALEQFSLQTPDDGLCRHNVYLLRQPLFLLCVSQCALNDIRSALAGCDNEYLQSASRFRSLPVEDRATSIG